MLTPGASHDFSCWCWGQSAERELLSLVAGLQLGEEVEVAAVNLSPKVASEDKLKVGTCALLHSAGRYRS